MTREMSFSPGWRSVVAHGLTVLVTLILVAVLFGDRLGLRRPPLARIGGEAVGRPSRAPLTRNRSRPRAARRDRTSAPASRPTRHLRPRTCSGDSTRMSGRTSRSMRP